MNSLRRSAEVRCQFDGSGDTLLASQLRAKPHPIDWKKVEAIQKEIAALAILDSRTADEILGYDEFGIPR